MNRVGIYSIVIPLTILVLIPIPVFADTFGIEDRVKSAFDWFFDYLKQSNQVSDAPSDQKQKTDNAIESGREFTSGGVGWYFDGHKFIVDVIFAGSPVPLDSGIIAIVAIFIMIFLIGRFLKDHLRHWFWIIIGVLIFVLFLILIGIKFQ